MEVKPPLAIFPKGETNSPRKIFHSQYTPFTFYYSTPSYTPTCAKAKINVLYN